MLEISGSTLTPAGAAQIAVSNFPPWVKLLMRLRDRIAGVVGLKTAGHHQPSHTDMIGMFPVISCSSDTIVLGFDDRHLDFRIVINVDNLPENRQRISVTTLVYRKILLGSLYIAVITPFHKLIVSTMLANLGKQAAVTERL